MKYFFVLTICFLLSACGQTGHLYLPRGSCPPIVQTPLPKPENIPVPNPLQESQLHHDN